MFEEKFTNIESFSSTARVVPSGDIIEAVGMKLANCVYQWVEETESREPCFQTSIV